MIPPLYTADGRRAWAFMAILGGCMVSTVYLFGATWFLRGEPGFLFWLAMAANVQLLIGLTLLGALFVRRTIRIDRNGVEISDQRFNEGQV